MKTTAVPARKSKKSRIRCVLCGDYIDPELEYLIWEENESRFWLCQKCSSMFTAENEDADFPSTFQPHRN